MRVRERGPERTTRATETCLSELQLLRFGGREYGVSGMCPSPLHKARHYGHGPYTYIFIQIYPGPERVLRSDCSADGYTEVFGSRMTYPSERVECLHANARGTS